VSIEDSALSQPTDDLPPAGFSPARFSGQFLHDAGPYFLRTTEACTIVGLRVRQNHVNYVGVAHGGVLTTMADVALSLQVHRLDPAGLPVTTVSLATNFLAAGKLGDWLEAECRIDRVGKRLAFTSGSIRCGDNVLMTMTGVFNLLRPPPA
jgi:uncharacterized protein (TIGR00369 family)